MASNGAAAAAATDPAAVVQVRMYDSEGQARRVERICRHKLVRHSAAFECFLREYKVEDERERTITLPYGFAAPRPLSIVLRSIHTSDERRGGHLVKIDRQLSTGERCLVWHAANALRLQPPWAEERLRNMISYRISHEQGTPYDMEMVYKVFYPYRDQYNPYKTLVHQHVWNKLHGNYKDEETVAGLDQTAARLDGFAEDLAAKLQDLEPGHRVFRLNRALNAARRNRGGRGKRLEPGRTGQHEAGRDEVREVGGEE